MGIHSGGALILSGLLLSSALAGLPPSLDPLERQAPPAPTAEPMAPVLGNAAEGGGGGSGDGPDLNDRGWKSGDSGSSATKGSASDDAQPDDRADTEEEAEE
ncbi:MAG: hypothetical protein ABWY06_05075 [Pseudomonas sp.]|uniref:hypothetical protein n=1 Tax=Pseudomonas sp. TaxID=306 RepID=UPI003391E2F8